MTVTKLETLNSISKRLLETMNLILLEEEKPEVTPVLIEGTPYLSVDKLYSIIKTETPQAGISLTKEKDKKVFFGKTYFTLRHVYYMLIYNGLHSEYEKLFDYVHDNKLTEIGPTIKEVGTHLDSYFIAIWSKSFANLKPQ